MNIYRYEQAFGAADKTTKAMRQAVADWESLYYQKEADASSDPCQRIGYTVVNKLVRSVFGEYQVRADDPAVASWVASLNTVKNTAVQMMLVGGECYLKPFPAGESFDFTLIPRSNALIFARDAAGNPTDLGTVERSTVGNHYFTLLERRTVDAKGFLTVENRLYRSANADTLGSPVPLTSHPLYADLPDTYCYGEPMGSVGVVRLKTPMLNCVDGSADGVAVFAPAVGLIRNIDRNEAQLNGEFLRGESRIIASSDLLDKAQGLSDHLFVGLNEDPETVGITVFSPQLRQQAFLDRKQEYLRNVESVIGLRRGMLSDSNIEDRTATEIASSAGDYNLAVIDFQAVWEQALRETVALCAALAKLYGGKGSRNLSISVDWGNGILYDEDKTWEQYKEMVAGGLLQPEIALGWRFNLPCDTEEEKAAIREKFMPKM